MAGLISGRRPTIRLGGFVLMESVFSMITIMICFGVCMMVFNMITSGGTGALQVSARIRLQAEAERCKRDMNFADGVMQLEEFSIEKLFIAHEELPGLTELSFTAVAPDGKIIAEYHEYVAR